MGKAAFWAAFFNSVSQDCFTSVVTSGERVATERGSRQGAYKPFPEKLAEVSVILRSRGLLVTGALKVTASEDARERSEPPVVLAGPQPQQPPVRPRRAHRARLG